MNAAASPRRNRALLLWWFFGVLILTALCVLFGSSPAHAEEKDDSTVGAVSSTVSSTVATVVEPVAEVTAPVAQATAPAESVVAPVTQQATAVAEPPVKQISQATKAAVAPVVEAAAPPIQTAAPAVKEATNAVVAPAATAVEQAPLVDEPVMEAVSSAVDTASTVVAGVPPAAITEPVAETVGTVPLVGETLTDLGLLPLIGDAVGTVDDLVGPILAPVVDEITLPILDAVSPGSTGSDPDVTESALPRGTIGDGLGWMLGREVWNEPTALRPGLLGTHSLLPGVGALGLIPATAAPPGDSTAPPTVEPRPGSPGSAGPPDAPSSSLTSAGSALLTAAVAQSSSEPSDDFGVSAEPTDDLLPPSRAGSTDVSPD